jgi:RDD family
MLGVVMLVFALIGAARASQPSDERLDATGVFVISIVVTFVLHLVYEVSLVGLSGRTLGKAALGYGSSASPTAVAPDSWVRCCAA